MIRYFLEKLDRKISSIVLQNENGVFLARTDGTIREYEGLRQIWVKLPGWEGSREVSTASREYLEYMREFERNSYTATRPTPIREEEGTISKLVEKILVRGR